MVLDEIQKLVEVSDTASESELQAKLNTLMKGKTLHEEIRSLSGYRKTQKGKIASKYNIKFQQYMLLFVFYDEVTRVIETAWNNSIDKDSTKYRINVVTKLYNKSRQTMLDLLPMLENGALPSSLTLWRSIYENYVFAKYLLSAPDEESNRFNDYFIIQTGQMSKAYSKKNKNLIKSLVEKYGEDFNKPYGWITLCNKKSIDGVIAHIKEKELVDFYRFSSMQLHASSFSINKSIFRDGNHGNADMIGAYSEDMEYPFNLIIKLMSFFTEMIVISFVKDDMRDILLGANTLLSGLTYIAENE